nr:HepT-like ribonuclease domain-containing protein [Rhizobium sp. G21]
MQRVDPGFAGLHPALPWKAMRGVRNQLVHGYFDINLDLVWTTVTRDLPAVILGVEALVGALKGPFGPE